MNQTPVNFECRPDSATVAYPYTKRWVQAGIYDRSIRNDGFHFKLYCFVKGIAFDFSDAQVLDWIVFDRFGRRLLLTFLMLGIYIRLCSTGLEGGSGEDNPKSHKYLGVCLTLP